MSKITHRNTTILAVTIALLASGVWYALSPVVTEAQKGGELMPSRTLQPARQGKYVIIRLDANELTLHDGTSTVATIHLVSQGKPGSYYETIGGNYMSDYKELVHFSSIGHVYMPFSIHLFGNYFIHGIPYYPDGTKVSSTYSGGCIRLEDRDAEHVYNFITPSVPIIVTRGSEDDFEATATTTPTITSMNMTRLMVATVSLEFLTQDNEILDTNGIDTTTRRTLLASYLLGKNPTVANLYAHSAGENTFVAYMNKKAAALGLTNTTFTGVNTGAITTEEDYARFMSYIITYKSYLQKVLEATTTEASSL